MTKKWAIASRAAANAAALFVSAAYTAAMIVATAAGADKIQTKWDLWNSGETLLRGANVYYSRVIPKLDGRRYKGPGPIGPPRSQSNLVALSRFGANYVVLSHPGIFTEKPPYQVYEGAQESLDRALRMVKNANMFATISIRGGPGRSDLGFWCSYDEPKNDCYPFLNDIVWENGEAQDAWVRMWRYMARRYRNNPVVVGYDLMVEPNSNDLNLGGIWDPDKFYSRYGGTTYDWNQLYPRIVKAIREEDPDTPILVSPHSYGAIEWLPYVSVLSDSKIVYAVHQYAPYSYTHQYPQKAKHSYPGTFDVYGDGQKERFNRKWLENNLMWTVDKFQRDNGRPLCVQEYGVKNFAPGGQGYMGDLMGLFNSRGMNHALWEWSTDFRLWLKKVSEFNFRRSNGLKRAIASEWAKNWVRPSNAPWATGVCKKLGQSCGRNKKCCVSRQHHICWKGRCRKCRTLGQPCRRGSDCCGSRRVCRVKRCRKK